MVAAPARASGVYFAERGVRPLARGGAFVAGADDLSAIWYNPAGIAEAGTSLLLDLAYVGYGAEYTRQTLVHDASGAVGTYTYPKARATSAFLPVPTIAGSYAFGPEKALVVAAGIFAPYAPIAQWESSVAGQPAGSRYALVSMEGTALVQGGAWLAWKPIPELRIGAGVQALVGSFSAISDLNVNPRDQLLSASEDPQYDTRTELAVGPIVAPTGNVGVTVVPWPFLRIGVSGQLPVNIDSPSKVRLRLPQAPLFETATQRGDSARVRFKLPGVLRAGVEVRPSDHFKVEVAYVRELWSAHSSIDIVPENIQLLDVRGLPSPFTVAAMSKPRGFVDSDSLRLGGEYAVAVGARTLHLRGGLSYDTTAVPRAYVTALTVDANKVTMGLGAGLQLTPRVRLDVLYAHVFVATVHVRADEALVPRVNPVRGNLTVVEGANGGTYASRGDIVGLGGELKF